MRTIRGAGLVWAALVLAACYGGFDETPLGDGPGEVEILVEGEMNAERAWLAVVGRPETRTGPDARGAFVLTDLDAGELTLAVATGEGRADRISLIVIAGRRVTAEVSPAAAAQVQGHLDFRGGPVPAQVRVEELPITASVAHDGSFFLGDLPPGCVHVWAEADGYAPSRQEICAEESEVVAPVLLLHRPEHGVAPVCHPCVEDGDCDSGLCIDHDVGHGLGESVCATSCVDDAHCPRAFTCTEIEGGGSACLPTEASCAAYVDVWEASACHGHEECGLDAHDGLCHEGACSLACTDDTGCPEGTTCDAHGHEAGACR